MILNVFRIYWWNYEWYTTPCLLSWAKYNFSSRAYFVFILCFVSSVCPRIWLNNLWNFMLDCSICKRLIHLFEAYVAVPPNLPQTTGERTWGAETETCSSQSAVWRDEGNSRPQLDDLGLWPKLDTGPEPRWWWGFEPRWRVHICSDFQCVLLLDVKSTYYPDQSFSQVHTARTKIGNAGAIINICDWFRNYYCILGYIWRASPRSDSSAIRDLHHAPRHHPQAGCVQLLWLQRHLPHHWAVETRLCVRGRGHQFSWHTATLLHSRIWVRIHRSSKYVFIVFPCKLYVPDIILN